MSGRRVIVGAIGGDDQKIIARDFGAAAARAGYIILTGGEVIDDDEVKNATMYGADRVEMAGGPKARLIGVLPSRVLEWSGSTHRVVLKTGLTSVQRDPINGLTPDVVVAFKGSAGTLCELGYALAAEKPVFYLGASAWLTKKFREHLASGRMRAFFETALSKYPNINSQSISSDGLIERLKEGLAKAANAEGDIESIIEQISKLPAGKLGFPGLPAGDASSIARFETVVRNLSND